MLKLLLTLVSLLVLQGFLYSANMGISIIVIWVVIGLVVSAIVFEVERTMPHADTN